jgi:hypothetical protein
MPGQAVGQAGEGVDGGALVQHVAVGEDNPLGRAGGARGVEHGHRVLRPDPPGQPLDQAGVGGQGVAAAGDQLLPGERARVAGQLPGVLQQHQVAELGQAVADLLPALGHLAILEDGDLGGAVAGAVADLLGGQGAVQGRRHPAGMHGGLVGEHVLDAVVHHQGDEVAGLQAQARKPGRDLDHPPALLGPGQRAPRLALAPVGGGPVAVPLGVVA